MNLRFHITKKQLSVVAIMLCISSSTMAKADVVTFEHQVVDSIVSEMISKFLVRMSVIDAVEENDGRIEKHIVDRGETWQTIAAKYGTSVDEIVMLNSFEKECTSGLEIDVPVFVTEEELDRLKRTALSSVLAEGHRALDAGDDKKAVKLFTMSIEDTPSADAYYHRGYAQMRRGKLSKAEDDIMVAITLDNSNLYPHKHELLEKIQQQIEYKKAKRNQFWNSLFQTVAEVGIAVTQTYMESQAYNSGGIHQSGNYGSTDGVAVPGEPGSALNLQLPACLDIRNYTDPSYMQTEFKFDDYGNLMVSHPGFAKMSRDMQNNFNSYMQSSGLLSANTPLNSALRSMMNIDTSFNEIEAQYWESWKYPSEVTLEETRKEMETKEEEGKVYNRYKLRNTGVVLSRVYSDYQSQLIDMKVYPSRYSDSRRKDIQAKMRQIREDLEKNNPGLAYKSDLETWMGD